MKEQWRDIKGFEGMYQVSNLGRIKSLPRKGNLKEKIRKLSSDRNGYLQLTIYKSNKHYTFKVHKLVAMAFLGHVPCGHEIVIDHIDGNKKNNAVTNLQELSNRDNVVKSKSKKLTGASYDKQMQKWRSQIRVNGKQKFLGLFKTQLDAHNRYKEELGVL